MRKHPKRNHYLGQTVLSGNSLQLLAEVLGIGGRLTAIKNDKRAVPQQKYGGLTVVVFVVFVANSVYASMR